MLIDDMEHEAPKKGRCTPLALRVGCISSVKAKTAEAARSGYEASCFHIKSWPFLFRKECGQWVGPTSVVTGGT